MLSIVTKKDVYGGWCTHRSIPKPKSRMSTVSPFKQTIHTYDDCHSLKAVEPDLDDAEKRLFRGVVRIGQGHCPHGFNVGGLVMVVLVEHKDLRGGAAALSEPNIVCCERAVGVAEKALLHHRL